MNKTKLAGKASKSVKKESEVAEANEQHESSSDAKTWLRNTRRVPGDPGKIIHTAKVPHPTKPHVEVEVSLRVPTRSDREGGV